MKFLNSHYPQKTASRKRGFFVLAMNKKTNKLLHSLASAGSVISFVLTIVSGTWFISTFEKRVTLVEQNNITTNLKLQELKAQLDEANTAQDNMFIRYQESISQQLIKMNDKVDKIYELMAERH